MRVRYCLRLRNECGRTLAIMKLDETSRERYLRLEQPGTFLVVVAGTQFERTFEMCPRLLRIAGGDERVAEPQSRVGFEARVIRPKWRTHDGFERRARRAGYIGGDRDYGKVQPGNHTDHNSRLQGSGNAAPNKMLVKFMD